MGAGGHDDLVALLFAEAVVGEDPALVLWPVAWLALAALFGPLLLNQLVGCEVGEVVESFDALLAERDEHLLGQMRHLGEIVGDAQRSAFFAGSRLAPLQRFGR